MKHKYKINSLLMLSDLNNDIFGYGRVLDRLANKYLGNNFQYLIETTAFNHNATEFQRELYDGILWWNHHRLKNTI